MSNMHTGYRQQLKLTASKSRHRYLGQMLAYAEALDPGRPAHTRPVDCSGRGCGGLHSIRGHARLPAAAEIPV
jgi:hypothetical protein